MKIPKSLSRLAVPLADLKPYSRNPRQGDVGAIATSLERNGQYRPIVARKGTGEILAGNHTYWAAKQLGWEKIAATWIECDDEQARRIVLADNRTADLADYDNGALIELLMEAADSEDGLLGTGFDGDDLDDLLKDAERARERGAELFGEERDQSRQWEGIYDDRVQLMFNLSKEERSEVLRALNKAKAAGAANQNEALLHICRGYVA